MNKYKAPVAVFLGLSGAGKTTLIHNIARCKQKILAVDASSFLNSADIETAVDRPEANQIKILSKLDELRWKSASYTILLSAHAIIESGAAEVIVPEWFFEKLSPNWIFHVEAPPEVILSRRRARGKLMGISRDRISQRQMKSRAYAQSLGMKMKLDVNLISSNEAGKVLKLMLLDGRE